MTTELCELAVRNGTDKCMHGYTPVYHSLFKDRRAEVKFVLEIGIHQGNSIRLWRDYFPNAWIFGIDKDPYWMIKNQERITTSVGDQRKADTLLAATNGHKFDLIVDDGGHKSDDQIPCALTLLPFLDANGYYFIEDVTRYPKPPAVGKDDPNDIIGHMPKEYDCELMRTGKANDDVIIVIKHKARDAK
jgi:hypothetical protein